MALHHLMAWAVITLVSIIVRARAGRFENLAQVWDDVIASALATAALTYVYYL